MEIQTTKTAAPASPKTVIAKLREEATKNPVFNDVCHVFATRERARQQVTLAALATTMKKQGFKHTRDQYGSVLGFMASLGLGHLDRDSKGRLRALKGIKVTLQSIGIAALNNVEPATLSRHSPQARFSKLPQHIIEAAPAKKPAETAPVKKTVQMPTAPAPSPKASSMCKIVFTVTVDDKTVTFDVPEGVPKEELGQFIASLYPRKPRTAV